MKANIACWPIATVAMIVIAVNVVFVCCRLMLPYPVSEWEAGLVNDAWRLATGLPVYRAPSEHATTMYGPAQMAVLAGLFDLLGPSLQAGRLLNIFAGLAAVLVLALSFARRNWLEIVVSVALLLSVNGWTGYYFVETRPDMVAVLWAVLGLLLLYRASEAANPAGEGGLAFVGSLLILTGAFFKQTMVVFVVVPLLAELLGRTAGRRYVVALLPPALALVAVAILRTSPSLWHFMVEVPSQYRIFPTGIFNGAKLLLGLPLFVLAVVHWLVTDARDNWRTPVARWLVVSAAIAIASSLPAYAKEGGTNNSLIPGLLAIGAFCTWRFSAALDLLNAPGRPWQLRLCAGMVLAVALFLHSLPSPAPLSAKMLKQGHGTLEYSALLEELRRLPGKVVSFDDPWMALKTKGYAGMVLVFEADAIGWNPARLKVLPEIETADYVVALRGIAVTGGPNWWPKEETLQAAGFVKADFPNVVSSVYQLWRRDRR